VEASGRPETPRNGLNGRAALVAASVFVLVFLVALGSSRSLARVRGPGHVLDARPIIGDLAVVFLVLGLAVLAALALTLWGGVRLRRRRDDEPERVVEPEPVPWWLKPILLLIALMPVGGTVAVVMFAGRGGGRQTQTIAPTLSVPQRPAQPGASPSGHGTAPLVHWWFWVALAVVALAATVIVFVRRRLRGAAPEGAHGVERRDLRAAIEESLDELEREPDPRRAVIRAYLGMEQALATQGLGRRPFEAPREYLARVLGAIRVSRTPGERLTALFQRARFSEHPIDRRMKREAIMALATVRDELGGRP
jgi:hypothetical protein